VNNKPSDSQNNSNSPFSNRNAQRIWLVVGVVVLLLFIVIFGGQPNSGQRGVSTSLDRVAEHIQQGNVTAITVRGGTDVFVELRNGTTAYYYKERETNLFAALETFGVTPEQFARVQFSERQGDNTTGLLFQLLVAIVPTLIIVWLLWRMMRSVRTGQDQALSFGRSRARVVRDMERPQVTFADVAGAEEAKQELAEVVRKSSSAWERASRKAS
jgi:cell division protease FtsH